MSDQNKKKGLKAVKVQWTAQLDAIPSTRSRNNVYFVSIGIADIQPRLISRDVRPT